MSETLKSSTKLLQFLKLHKKWSEWLGANQENIEKNTLYHQCIEMIDNHFAFIGLNRAGYHTSQDEGLDKYFSLNNAFSKFIWESYIAFQCTSIRRITDNDNRDENHSLKRLLSNLKSNSHLITREVFVCFLGYPYEYEEELKAHHVKVREQLLENPGKVLGFDIPKAKFSMERHVIFDRLSGTNSDQRKLTDKIQDSYWDELERKLNICEIEQIRNFTDKYIAHAADKKSARCLREDDKTISLHKIESCHLAILEVFSRLTLDFWFTTISVEPISDRITDYMDRRYANSEAIETAKKMLDSKEREYLKVQGITLG